MKFCAYILLFLVNYVLISQGTLSKSDKKDKNVIKKVSGVQEQTVEERGLVSKTLKWKDVVEQSEGYKPSTSSTHLTVLAYVTPWNNHGYDVAKWQAAKFNLVSPVWLQLKIHEHGNEHGGYLISGQFDIDKGWVEDVRGAAKEKGRKAKVVPRLIFEGWSMASFQSLVDSQESRAVLVQRLIDVLEAHSLDGYVLELWSQLPHQKFFNTMPSVIADISDALRAAGYVVVLVIPPATYGRNIPGMFLAPHFKALVPHVDYFSLMTYDYSNFQRPGPNSPIWWVRECVVALAPSDTDPDRKKILLGMNLYGLEHTLTGGRHILGRDYIEILQKYKPSIKYIEDDAEHFIEYKAESGKSRVYYPSLYSIKERIALAKSLNTGISLWEIGQGLDYFYDLF